MKLRPRLALFAFFSIPTLASLGSLRAEAPAVQFGGGELVSNEFAFLSRPPEPAEGATQALYAFGPAAPESGYDGPPFLFGYEIRSSAPADLSVAQERMTIEDNLHDGGSLVDALSVRPVGDWSADATFSVAAAVVFPLASATRLESLRYSALNWTDNPSYNEVVRARWVVQTGGRYYVNAASLGRTASPAEGQAVNEMRVDRGATLADVWVAYDPESSIFAALDGDKIRLGAALDEVTAVGLYMDALDFRGPGAEKRLWQFKLLRFAANAPQ